MEGQSRNTFDSQLSLTSTRDDRGVTILLFALLLVAVLSVIALALDGGTMMEHRQIFRAALDAGAYRGALQLHEGETDLEKIRTTVDAMVRSNLHSVGVDPANMESITTMFSEGNTRVDVQGTLSSRFWFARAIPGMGSGRTISEASAALYRREEVTVNNGDEANLVAVVDTSCSMRWWHTESSTYLRRDGTTATGKRRLHAVIAALQRLIQESKSGRYLSIVTFDTISRTRLAPIRITDDVEPGQTLTNRQRAMETTYDLAKKHTRCSTRTADGMLLGLVNLKSTLGKPEISSPDQVKVVLITDGGATHAVTAAMPALGLETLRETVNMVDDSTWGMCNLGSKVIRGSVDTVKVAEIMRKLGVTVHVLGVGDMSALVQGALQLVAGAEGTTGALPCRLLPEPFVISAENISPPPGEFVYKVSDVERIFRRLAGTETTLNISSPRLVHPTSQGSATNSQSGSGSLGQDSDANPESDIDDDDAPGDVEDSEDESSESNP